MEGTEKTAYLAYAELSFTAIPHAKEKGRFGRRAVRCCAAIPACCFWGVVAMVQPGVMAEEAPAVDGTAEERMPQSSGTGGIKRCTEILPYDVTIRKRREGIQPIRRPAATPEPAKP